MIFLNCEQICRTIEEAIQRANNTRYGLAAGIITKDLNVANTVSRSIRAGVIWINCYFGFDRDCPYGGYKQSGFGRDFGMDALYKYLQVKSITTPLYNSPWLWNQNACQHTWNKTVVFFVFFLMVLFLEILDCVTLSFVLLVDASIAKEVHKDPYKWNSQVIGVANACFHLAWRLKLIFLVYIFLNIKFADNNKNGNVWQIPWILKMLASQNWSFQNRKQSMPAIRKDKKIKIRFNQEVFDFHNSWFLHSLIS